MGEIITFRTGSTIEDQSMCKNCYIIGIINMENSRRQRYWSNWNAFSEIM